MLLNLFTKKALWRRNAGIKFREGSKVEQYRALSLYERDIPAFLKIRI